jgi:hypothetical protein
MCCNVVMLPKLDLDVKDHPQIPKQAGVTKQHNSNLKSNSVMRLATATVETSSDYC